MATPPRNRHWSGQLGWVLLAVFILFVALPFLELPIQLAGILLVGWLSYLHRVLPRVSFNAEIATNAGIALILASAALHRVLVWWARTQSGEGVRWRFVSTLKIVSMILLLFATSIAATGIVHQVGWLFRAERLTYDASRGLMTREMSNIKQVAVALHLYAEDTGGKQPRDLDELIPDYLADRGIFFSTFERGEPPERILYFPDNQGPEGSDPARAIVLAGPREGATAKRCVGYRDTSAWVVPETEFQQFLRQQMPASARSAPQP